MTASLWAAAVVAFGAPSLDFNRRKNAPNPVWLRCNVLAAMRRADEALFPVRLLLPPSRLPPDTLFPGHNPNQDANCLLVFHRLKSRPISDTILSALEASIPGISVKSTQVMRRNCDL